MILSISRRTDIPACYSGWLAKRLEEGYVLVPNPRNPRRFSKVMLTGEQVECAVFWSKNPAPILPLLEDLPFPFYVQYTLNPYGPDWEPGLPSIQDRLKTMERLGKWGKERLVWRYDPVILSAEWTVQRHKEAFRRLAAAAAQYTDSCVISFLDLYAHIRRPLKERGMRPPEFPEMEELAKSFGETAREFSLKITACAETGDFSAYGIGRGSCIDSERISRITGLTVKGKKDAGQRPECGCLESVDIGVYHTCRHGCVYCYAAGAAHSTAGQLYDPNSPVLCGSVPPDGLITQRKTSTVLEAQTKLPGLGGQ